MSFNCSVDFIGERFHDLPCVFVFMAYPVFCNLTFIKLQIFRYYSKYFLQFFHLPISLLAPSFKTFCRYFFSRRNSGFANLTYVDVGRSLLQFSVLASEVSVAFQTRRKLFKLGKQSSGHRKLCQWKLNLLVVHSLLKHCLSCVPRLFTAFGILPKRQKLEPKIALDFDRHKCTSIY